MHAVGTYTCRLINGIAKWELDEGSCHDEDLNPNATVALFTSSPETLVLTVVDLIEAGTIDPPTALCLLTNLTNVVIEENGIEDDDVRL